VHESTRSPCTADLRPAREIRCQKMCYREIIVAVNCVAGTEVVTTPSPVSASSEAHQQRLPAGNSQQPARPTVTATRKSTPVKLGTGQHAGLSAFHDKIVRYEYRFQPIPVSKHSVCRQYLSLLYCIVGCHYSDSNCGFLNNLRASVPNTS